MKLIELRMKILFFQRPWEFTIPIIVSLSLAHHFRFLICIFFKDFAFSLLLYVWVFMLINVFFGCLHRTTFMSFGHCWTFCYLRFLVLLKPLMSGFKFLVKMIRKRLFNSFTRYKKKQLESTFIYMYNAIIRKRKWKYIQCYEYIKC